MGHTNKTEAEWSQTLNPWDRSAQSSALILHLLSSGHDLVNAALQIESLLRNIV